MSIVIDVDCAASDKIPNPFYPWKGEMVWPDTCVNDINVLIDSGTLIEAVTCLAVYRSIDNMFFWRRYSD
jgi:hypothetical protein